MFNQLPCLLLAAAVLPSAIGGPAHKPINYGIIVFPNFEVIDIFGPLDILNDVSLSYPINLSIIASTLDPVSSAPLNLTGALNPAGSRFAESIVPTHTFKHPPKDLDVLIVPGGQGTRAEPPALLDAIDYIKHEYPHLQYLISVCTGATLLARSGVLDGKRATTAKKPWTWATSTGPKVDWVPVARWVTDGNIWTTSGVTAGIDGMFAFVDFLYGDNYTTSVSNEMEYVRITNSTDDPFSAIFNTTGSS